MPYSVNAWHVSCNLFFMTNSEITEICIRQLAKLIYNGWQGDGREIVTDYAYLLTKGGRNELLDKHIKEFQEMNDSEDDDDYEET